MGMQGGGRRGGGKRTKELKTGVISVKRMQRCLLCGVPDCARGQVWHCALDMHVFPYAFTCNT